MAVNRAGKEITSIWTPANVVTCVRIVFIPVFMVLIEWSFAEYSAQNAVGGSSWFAGMLGLAAFGLYAVLSLTDKVDGQLARSRGEITDFGKFLDPIADKLLVFSALLILLEWGMVSIWFVFIILLREFLVSALRMVAGANGVVIAADKLGKWKTAVTMLAICGYLLACPLQMLSPAMSDGIVGIGLYSISSLLMFAAVVLTVVSGVQYFWNARKAIFKV